MKPTHVLTAVMAAFAAAALGAGAVSSLAPAPGKDPRAVHVGTVRNAYWLKGSEIEGYTSADEGHLKADKVVKLSVRVEASATVFPDWVVINSRWGINVIPREHIVLLELDEIPLARSAREPQK